LMSILASQPCVVLLRHHLLCRSTTPPPPTSTLFPYTTLFRSSLYASNDLEPGDVFREVTVTAKKQISPTVWEYTLQGELVSPERSEEHTSELQSRFDLVCRLLLEKKKNQSRRTS